MPQRQHKWICEARESRTLSSSTKRVGTACARLLLLITIVGLTAGCVTSSKTKLTAADVDKRLRQLQRELKTKKLELEDMRERNLVLEKRSEINSEMKSGANSGTNRAAADSDGGWRGGLSAVPIPFHPSAGNDGSVQVGDGEIHLPLVRDVVARVTAPPRKPSSVESVGSAKTGEQQLYSKVLETYRSRNREDMQKSLQLLLKNYPSSVFADNALYMAGLLAFESDDLPQALRLMGRVMSDYPRGNKAVAALFARASIEKKMRRFGDARLAFKKLKVLYPGSPEAARVAFELKLLDKAATNRREI